MKLLIAFIIGLPIFMFQNCSKDVGFSESLKVAPSSDNSGQGNLDVVNDINDDLNDGDEEDDLDLIKKLCKSSRVKVELKKFNFPKPNRTCDWEMDGNLSRKNEYFRARIEQHRSLGLPKGAVICDTKFEFSKQDFLYDDHFLLLFNKKVIASSYDFTSKLNRGNYNLLTYDWNKLVGMYWDGSKETIFCPQGTSIKNNCDFPGHDKQGTIEIEYDADFIKAIMSEGIPEDHSFSMVSIGDDDNLDCEHSNVDFDVQVSYVLPAE